MPKVKTISLKKALQNGNSIVNQEIKGKLIEREVYCNVNLLMEYSLGKSYEQEEPPFTYDDIENLMVTNEETNEEEQQEIYEWWAVSSWFAEKLKVKGKPVIISGYGASYWGRCTTGQAILLDYVITEICADMGILEGQENSWATKG